MSLNAMPIVIINMGGEMVYILDQRLNAQKIVSQKRKKVLGDVVKTMYNPNFVNELFRPQALYSPTSTRQIFDRLAHSSIMKLNPSSMDKLYDLMTMAFKYQVLSANSPSQFLQITLNHLETLKMIVDTPEISELVDIACSSAISLYASMTIGELFAVKHELCRFFQGRKVKVSLFLKDGLQDMQGVIKLPCEGPVPQGSEVPGVIKYFNKNRKVQRTEHLKVAAKGVESLPEMDDLACCTLGFNMYSDSEARQPKLGEATLSMIAQAKAGATEGAMERIKASSKMPAKSSAKDELNLLAGLISTEDSKSDLSKPFKINLFPDMSADSKDSDDPLSVPIIEIDAKSEYKDMDRRMEELDLKDSGEKGVEDDDDDLLAMMDSASH